MDTTVEKIGKINIQGNVIPMCWFEYIKTEAGKPDSIGIMLLADIVYWYKPTIIRDEATGRVLGYRKKFKADKLQRSYDQFANQFGYSKNQVRRALKRLEDQGLIMLELRNITTNTGLKLANVMYIEPIPEEIEKITHTKDEIIEDIPSEQESTDVSTNLHTPPYKKIDTPLQKCIDPPCKNVGTYTETPTKTPTEIPTTTSVYCDADLAKVAKTYESGGFGQITAITGELLEDLIKDYSAQWVIDAMKEAVKQNKRKLSYVGGILQNWKANGRDNDYGGFKRNRRNSEKTTNNADWENEPDTL